MSELVRCQNCNAPLKPVSDGRTTRCEHCGAEVRVAVGAEELAKGLKLDLNDIEAFVSQLAHALHAGMKERSKLQLQGTQVLMFELDLGNDMFVVIRESGSVVTRHKKMVRGIALKTATHPIDRWVELLSKALAAHANENARVAQVLSQLKGA
ncbi:MAG: hypothetical protein QM723_35080 [Myxococcaceae bacterium]